MHRFQLDKHTLVFPVVISHLGKTHAHWMMVVHWPLVMMTDPDCH